MNLGGKIVVFVVAVSLGNYQSDGGLFHFESTLLSSGVNHIDFENKRFPLNACLLSRLFQTGKVQTKAETMGGNMRWQGSSSKHLFLELPGCTFHLKEG